MIRGSAQAPFGRRRVPVLERLQYGSYTVLRCVDAAGPAPGPGQFYMLASAERWGGGNGERPYLPRAFSVLRAREREGGSSELQFLIEDVGPGTKRLCELDGGDELAVVGPLGSSFAPPRPDRRPLLVGGGVGIAPLAILQDELDAGPAPLLGFRDREHAEGARLLAGARVATDDGSVGHHGLVTELLEQELEGAAGELEIYSCGPPAMLEAVRLQCEAHRAPAQLALESGMACGFGACFGCVVETRDGYVRLCLEGPVLDAARLPGADLAEHGSAPRPLGAEV